MNRFDFHFSIRGKLILFAVIVSILFSIIIYGLIIPLVEKEKWAERHNTLQVITESIYSLADYFEKGLHSAQWEHDPSFPRTREEAQKHLLNHMTVLRYGEDEHVFFLDGSSFMLMHSSMPEFNGKSMAEVQSSDGRYPFREITAEARKAGTVFINYTWPSDDAVSGEEPLTACAKHFAPWDWVICSSLHTQDIDRAVYTVKMRATYYIILGTFAGFLLTALIAGLIARPLVLLTEQVRKASREFDGRTSAAITVEGTDEIGDLAEAFRQAFDSLGSAMAILSEKEEDLRITLDSIGDAVISTDINGCILRMNPVAEQLTGWSMNEAAGQELTTVFSIINAHTRKPVENPAGKVLDTGKIVGLANHTILIAKDGTEYQIADSAAPILNPEGSIIGVVLVFRDITEEYSVRQQLQKMALLVESASSPIAMSDLEGKLSYVNPAFLNCWGYNAREEVLGNHITEYWDIEERLETIFDKLEKDGEINEEAIAVRPDGSKFTVQVSASKVYDSEGKPLGLVSTSQDISERKQMEEDIKQSLQEKEVLLGEVHHRVKNNMQVIIAMLNLQKTRSGNALVPILEAIEGRMRIFSDIHNSLYQEQELSKIDITRHITDNFNNQVMANGLSPDDYTIDIEINHPEFGLDTAIPCGLLINELITNSFKHAFSGPGKISIKIETGENGKILRIVYSDTGAEIQNKGDGFGSELIKAFSAQLDLTYTVNPEGPDKYTFTAESLQDK